MAPQASPERRSTNLKASKLLLVIPKNFPTQEQAFAIGPKLLNSLIPHLGSIPKPIVIRLGPCPESF